MFIHAAQRAETLVIELQCRGIKRYLHYAHGFLILSLRCALICFLIFTSARSPRFNLELVESSAAPRETHRVHYRPAILRRYIFIPIQMCTYAHAAARAQR